MIDIGSAISMMSWPRVIRRGGLVSVLLLFLAGCSRGHRDLPDVLMELAVSPDPPRVGPALVTVLLADASGMALTGASVELEGNMSHAGMVPVTSNAIEVRAGRYEASLEFTMRGDWFILVRAELADGRALERKVDVPAVGLPDGETPIP